jgi:hypothetical protein
VEELGEMKYPEIVAEQDRHLVEMMATIMMMMSGIAASLVNKPTMMRVPQMVSTMPTNDPITSG